ncbi:AbrB family transcriptional regulator [Paenibacillus sp. IB182496]|uniref:AbrB family transcriptional regulator n=1 Tax=Paenibacillus sabuli TaxID=2772509 RepID=A0A927GQ11_9BACL|nr:AbrB family transcriptional regulator [Paenibacillus sabuli]MBD2843796.1 AbrB family transcriptional regulator [Paenibacillus sabuli]
MPDTIGRLAATAGIGLCGGALFQLLHLPLAWMLGPALALMVLNAVRPGLALWPRLCGDFGILVIAYSLGRRMDGETGRLMLEQLPWMVLAAVFWFVLCLLAGLAIARRAQVDRTSALLGSVPGGLAQMVYMAEQFKGADVGTVALIQTARLIVVLYAVPLLAAHALLGHRAVVDSDGAAGVTAAASGVASIADGAAGSAAFGWGTWALLALVPVSSWLARRLRLPAGELLGPLLFVGGLAIAGWGWPQAPEPLVGAGQWLFGSYLGNRVRLRLLLENKRLGPLAVLTSLLLMAVTVLLAWGLAQLTPISMLTWFLSLAPGGLGEVSVTALALDADLSHVTAYQMARLLVVLLLAKAVAARLAARERSADGG